MTTAVFDTLKAFRKLESAGMETNQAKAVVDTLTEAFDDNVATKADLAEVKFDLKQDIAEIKTEIAEVKADIAEVRADLKSEVADLRSEVRTEIASVKADLRIIKYFFGPAIILLLLKIAFFS